MLSSRTVALLGLSLALNNAEATNNLVANWQSATYFFQNRAIHYYYFDLQTQGGLAPAGDYQISCQIQNQSPLDCHLQLLIIPNQQNAIQQCFSDNRNAPHYCMLFSPCQNWVNCNTTYYQSSSCKSLTFINHYRSAWFSAARFYYLITDPTYSSISTSPPNFICTMNQLHQA